MEALAGKLTLFAWPHVTVTVQVSVKFPSAVLTVMVAVPLLTPVTAPVVAFTVATAVLSDVNETVLFAASAGATVKDGVFV